MTLRNRNRYAVRREEGRLHQSIYSACAELMGRTVRLSSFLGVLERERSVYEMHIIVRENYIGQVVGFHAATGELQVRFGDVHTGLAFMWLHTSRLELVSP